MSVLIFSYSYVHENYVTFYVVGNGRRQSCANPASKGLVQKDHLFMHMPVCNYTCVCIPSPINSYLNSKTVMWPSLCDLNVPSHGGMEGSYSAYTCNFPSCLRFG